MFKVQTKEDISSVAWLTPENRQMPQREKGVSLIARMEVNPAVGIQERLALASARGMSMDDAVGPAVGVLTATYGTSTISCVYDFDIPEEVEQCVVEGRIELWGLNVRPPCCSLARTLTWFACTLSFCMFSADVCSVCEPGMVLRCWSRRETPQLK